MAGQLTPDFLVTWLAGSVRLGAPLLLAATGEIYAERSGVVNVGIEGTILIGALASFLGAYVTGDPWMGLPAALAAGLVSNLGLAWMYVTVQANQVVVGITYNLMMLGLCSYLYRAILGADATEAAIPMLPSLNAPTLVAIPVVGPIFFAQPVMLCATLVLVGIAGYILYRRHFGLDLRAVGKTRKRQRQLGYGCGACVMSGSSSGRLRRTRRLLSHVVPNWHLSR